VAVEAIQNGVDQSPSRRAVETGAVCKRFRACVDVLPVAIEAPLFFLSVPLGFRFCFAFAMLLAPLHFAGKPIPVCRVGRLRYSAAALKSRLLRLCSLFLAVFHCYCLIE
jgi:hypothetical protein